MTQDVVVTKEQIRLLVAEESMKPADIFSAAALDEYYQGRKIHEDAARELEAEARARAKLEAEEKGKAEEGPEKYLDPKRNPFIKVEPTDADADGGEPDSKYLDPKQNPFIKIE